EKVMAGQIYPQAGALQPAAMAELDNAVGAATSQPGSRIQVEVHDDAEGGKMQAQIRTARLAAELKTYFIDKGIPEAQLEVPAHGAARPVMPGESRRARDLNRRVIVRVLPPAHESPSQPTSEPRARV